MNERIKYLLAVDYLQGFYSRERALMSPVEEKLGRPARPIEGGIETAIRVNNNRLRVVYGYPIQLILRWSGIDNLYRRYIVHDLISKVK